MRKMEKVSSESFSGLKTDHRLVTGTDLNRAAAFCSLHADNIKKEKPVGDGRSAHLRNARTLMSRIVPHKFFYSSKRCVAPSKLDRPGIQVLNIYWPNALQIITIINKIR